MGLVLDDLFKKHFKEYHKETRFSSLEENLEEYFTERAFPNEMLIDSANIVKTSDTIGETYRECFERISNDVSCLTYFGEEFYVEGFIFSLVAYHLLKAGDEEFIKFLEKDKEEEEEMAAKLDRSALSDTDELHKKSGWDRYFYNFCVDAAENSKCFSRVIGSVLVSDKTVIGTGYNGPPRGIPPCDQRWLLDDNLVKEYHSRLNQSPLDEKGRIKKELLGKCPRKVLGFKSGEHMEWCVAGHAEENAIVNSARMGIETRGASLYMSCAIPCSKCLVKIINAGIEEIIVTGFTFYDVSSEYLLKTSNLRVRMFDFLEKN
jgi:dCMP deaminase